MSVHMRTYRQVTWHQLLWAGPWSESRSVLQSLQSLTMSIHSMKYILVAKCNLTKSWLEKTACFPRPSLFKWANISVDTIYSAWCSIQGFCETQSCIISTWPSQIASSLHSQQPCTQRTCICGHGLCLHSSDSGYSIKHGSNWGQEA